MKIQIQMVKRLVEELFIIVTGVLVALAINAFFAKMSEESFLAKSLKLINEEHSDNVKNLKAAIENHTTLLNNLSKSVGTEETIYEIIVGSGGFKTSFISNTAWNRLLAKNIELVDYRIIKQLTMIDHQIESINAIRGRLAETGYGNAFTSDKNSKLLIASLMQDLIYSEKQLLTGYEEFSKLVTQ